MRHRLLSLTAALALSLGAVGSASAATEQETLNISAQSYAACQLQIVNHIEMVGVYGLDNEANAFGGGSLEVLCNPEVSYTVEPGDGQFFGYNPTHPTKRAAVGSLNMGYFLPYTLHKDSQTTMPWGLGGDAFTGYGTGAWQPYTFSAKFYDFSQLAPDTYTDQVVVTLTYF